MISDRRLYVHVQLPDGLDIVPAAMLRVQQLDDGSWLGTFRYGDRYLKRSNAVSLDPFKLPLTDNVQQFTKLKGVPGAVRDAGPDAWGRRVIEHKLEKSPQDLQEVDYLLNGPQDAAGYLSFGESTKAPIVRHRFNKTHQLEALVNAAHDIEDGKRVPVHILEQLEPGTSMGGARPKATIEDAGRLWIGKFPEKADRFNVQRVEYGTLELARACGLNVTTARVTPVADFDVLLVERFDRKASPSGYLRYGLVSAFTMLDAEESHLDRAKWSYPLLADEVRRWSHKPADDALELFKRMVFNAAVTNNDDHPRNHAVLRTADGWRLTPAYDLVPAPVVSLERRDLALTVGDFGRTASMYNLVSNCGRFGIAIDEARNIINGIVEVVKSWRAVFQNAGVSSKDVEYIKAAFLPDCFFFEKGPEAA